MWQRTAPTLERLDVLKEQDLGVLAAYCCAWAQLVEAVKVYQAQGFTITNRRSGRVTVTVNRQISALSTVKMT